MARRGTPGGGVPRVRHRSELRVRTGNTMTIANKAQRARSRARNIAVDQALMTILIGAMNANGHVAREELARAHHLSWSTRRFRRKSGETVGRLIFRTKRLLEAADAAEDATVVESAARTVP